MKNILPTPYSTDCFDYSNNIHFKSETYCKLDYMRRKELKECKTNNYWNQNLLEYKNQTHFQYIIFNSTFSNCSIKVDEKQLTKYCKPDCVQTQLSVIAVKSEQHYEPRNIFLFIDFSKTTYILITYLPKMDVIKVYAKLGRTSIHVFWIHCFRLFKDINWIILFNLFKTFMHKSKKRFRFNKE